MKPIAASARGAAIGVFMGPIIVILSGAAGAVEGPLNGAGLNELLPVVQFFVQRSLHSVVQLAKSEYFLRYRFLGRDDKLISVKSLVIAICIEPVPLPCALAKKHM